MSAKWLHLFFLLLASSSWAASQPYRNSRTPQNEDPSSAIRPLQIALADLKNDVRNHESEIRIFEEKLYNQESSFEHLRQQLTQDLQAQRDLARTSTINLDGKTETLDQSVKNLENLFRGVMTDLRQIKTQANDSIATLGQYKQKMTELEKLLDTQNQHMGNLEAALHSMMEVMQAKTATKEIATKEEEGQKTYKVQPGDTLEKIARSQKVTVAALREINQLTNDRIVVGKTLKIP
jgi:LysM repeat protein